MFYLILICNSNEFLLEIDFSGWFDGIGTRTRDAGLTCDYKNFRWEEVLEIFIMAANKKRTWQEFQKFVGEKRSKYSIGTAKG